jgi:hypothetical protein
MRCRAFDAAPAIRAHRRLSAAAPHLRINEPASRAAATHIEIDVRISKELRPSIDHFDPIHEIPQ